jgi:hypothetical protein
LVDSGAQNRRASRERARELAEAGQLELKLLVRVTDCEPLIVTGDFSEDDARQAFGGFGRTLPRHDPSLRRASGGAACEPSSLYRLTVPGSRTPIGEATLADLELARHQLRREAVELARWDRWLQLIAPTLATGKSVQEVLDLEQLRVMHRLGRPR